MNKKLLLFFLIFIFGCSSYIRTIVKIRPLQGIEGYTINEITNSVSKTFENVKIVLKPLTRNLIEGVSENIYTNPYMDKEKILFTVFEIEVENKSENKISIDVEKCVLLDDLGNQYNALTLSDFERMYPTTSSSTLTYSPIFKEYVPTIVYTNDYYKRKVAADTLFKSGDIYPNVKKRGLLVFELVKEDAKRIELIISSVSFYKNNELDKKIDFKFSFIQEILVKE